MTITLIPWLVYQEGLIKRLFSILGEIIIRIDNTHSKLVVSGIQDTVQYECSGINNYGEGNRLVSHISVIKPNGKCFLQNISNKWMFMDISIPK